MSAQAKFLGTEYKEWKHVPGCGKPSSTTTESSSSKTKDGIKTSTTKYITTNRNPTKEADQPSRVVSKETKKIDDFTEDNITTTFQITNEVAIEVITRIRTESRPVYGKSVSRPAARAALAKGTPGPVIKPVEGPTQSTATEALTPEEERSKLKKEIEQIEAMIAEKTKLEAEIKEIQGALGTNSN